ncbi:hypothetical protein [Seonamhaeicola marinus]|nr:hypothetical protein [Seonamhaeicola marinus]
MLSTHSVFWMTSNNNTASKGMLDKMEGEEFISPGRRIRFSSEKLLFP